MFITSEVNLSNVGEFMNELIYHKKKKIQNT